MNRHNKEYKKGIMNQVQLNYKQKQLLKDLYQNFLEGYEHPLLHAKSLGFKHPISGKDLFFTAPPPSPFKDLLQYLEENKNKTS